MLYIGVIIAIIIGSQLVSNVDISKDKSCVEAEPLIFISKKSGFYCYME